jgi:hypothetical protein
MQIRAADCKKTGNTYNPRINLSGKRRPCKTRATGLNTEGKVVTNGDRDIRDCRGRVLFWGSSLEQRGASEAHVNARARLVTSLVIKNKYGTFISTRLISGFLSQLGLSQGKKKEGQCYLLDPNPARKDHGLYYGWF